MPSNLVPLFELEGYVNQLEASGEWITEFKSQGDPTKQEKSLEVAHRIANCEKHRYPADNLGAYDETRVVLSNIPGESENSDYINANWVNGYKGRRRYIVTQAPLTNTVDDFYRMVWENNVHQIVMLASHKDIEQDKCIVYYPEGSMTFGQTNVTLERKTHHEDIVRRVYAVKRENIVRVLVHYHFTAWPDRGVPKDPSQILRLIQKYRSSDTFSTALPVLVHCSAGVGRTGSFMLSDIVYDMAKTEEKVDFLQHLCLLRNQRISMVEKPEQYFYAHKVILLALQKGLFKIRTD